MDAEMTEYLNKLITVEDEKAGTLSPASKNILIYDLKFLGIAFHTVVGITWFEPQKMQIKETSDLYVTCTSVCFDRCVTNFTARKLQDSELDCIEKCSQKFAKMNQRLTLRLFEMNKEEVAKPK